MQIADCSSVVDGLLESRSPAKVNAILQMAQLMAIQQITNLDRSIESSLDLEVELDFPTSTRSAAMMSVLPG